MCLSDVTDYVGEKESIQLENKSLEQKKCQLRLVFMRWMTLSHQRLVHQSHNGTASSKVHRRRFVLEYTQLILVLNWTHNQTVSDLDQHRSVTTLIFVTFELEADMTGLAGVEFAAGENRYRGNSADNALSLEWHIYKKWYFLYTEHIYDDHMVHIRPSDNAITLSVCNKWPWCDVIWWR